MARLTEMQKKRSLECLRLAADCRNLAWSGHTPDNTKRFLEMATVWMALADQTSEISATNSDEISA